ncbi:MAG: protein of uncharacterized function, partial [Frankiales bacterium]|nr:protein of uncharacterized function [Frankiales bacterium]
GPDPEPTWAEREWHAQQEDQQGVHDDSTDPSVSAVRRNTWGPSYRAQQLREERLERQARASRWTTSGLHDAVTRFRTAAPCPVPDQSNGYLFRGRLRRWIQARDITCTFPGCERIAQRCEIDHVVAYPSGPTSHGNAACECVHHHQAKHATIPAIRRTDGSMHWTNRFGVTAERPPRPLLRGW